MGGVQDQIDQHGGTLSLLKTQKTNQTWCWVLLRGLRQENHLNLRGRGCSELRLRHRTPAWVLEEDSKKKKKKRRNSWVVFPRYLEKFVFWARRNGLRYMLWVGECIFSISCFTSKAQQSCMNGRLSALSQELVNMLLKLFSLWMTLALSNRMKRKMAWGYFFPFVNLEVARILVCYLYLGNSLSNFYDYRL